MAATLLQTKRKMYELFQNLVKEPAEDLANGTKKHLYSWSEKGKRAEKLRNGVYDAYRKQDRFW